MQFAVRIKLAAGISIEIVMPFATPSNFMLLFHSSNFVIEIKVCKLRAKSNLMQHTRALYNTRRASETHAPSSSTDRSYIERVSHKLDTIYIHIEFDSNSFQIKQSVTRNCANCVPSFYSILAYNSLDWIVVCRPFSFTFPIFCLFHSVRMQTVSAKVFQSTLQLTVGIIGRQLSSWTKYLGIYNIKSS